MSSTSPGTEEAVRTPSLSPSPSILLRGEFTYDAREASWAWLPVVRTDDGYDYPSSAPAGDLRPVGEEIWDDERAPVSAAVIEELDESIRRGTPFSLGRHVVDEAGVAHEVVVCGRPESHEGRTTVRGMVVEVGSPEVSVLPQLTHRLGRLPDGISPHDLPWAELPAGLLATVNLCLESSAPTCLIWGEDRRLIYNSAYLEIAGDRHPTLFGAALAKQWPDVWELVGRQLDAVFATGEPGTLVDQPIPILRAGQQLDCFFTYALTPIKGEDGTVIGLFVPIVDTTGDVRRRRRLATLHELAAEGVVDSSPEELYTRMAGVLAGNLDDVPYSLMYLLDSGDRTAVLQASTGLPAGAACAPERIKLDADAEWPITEAISRGTPLLVDDVDRRFPGLLVGEPPVVPQRALISYVDLDHERLPNAINILGVGTRQDLDAEYQSFLHKVARHLHADLAAVATARLDRERSANLQRAMQSNRQIGAAIGILMTIHKVTEQQAFLLLSKASQQSNRKLRDIADDVILSGTLPPESITPTQRRPHSKRRA